MLLLSILLASATLVTPVKVGVMVSLSPVIGMVNTLPVASGVKVTPSKVTV